MSGRSGGDVVHLEDQQQKTSLGPDLWTLRQQDYFTDLALVGTDGKLVKGHLCVIAVSSPLVKNQAGSGGTGTQHRNDGRVTINVPNHTSGVIEHFMSFAYRCQVDIPADLVKDLYNLADYFMDLNLQQTITNTVGSVPANVPDIAKQLGNADPGLDLDDRESAQALNAMAKKKGRRKGRLPKKNHIKKEATPDSMDFTVEQGETSRAQENGETSTGITRIKRKSAVDATLKLRRATAAAVNEATSGDMDDGKS
jgi:hypothetical protein